MIRGLITRLRDARIRHHDARAQVFGLAVLTAQLNRDWPAAGKFLRYMHAAQAKRDALIAKQPRTHQCGRCQTVYLKAQDCDWCPGSFVR